MRSRRPAVGRPRNECVATHRRKVAVPLVGVVVEEDRYREGLGPPDAERARVERGRGACIVAALERDERHDVERAEARVHAGMSGDRDAAGDGGCQRDDRVGGIARGRAGEREHRTVVVVVDVHVEERGAARGLECPHRGTIASGGHVGDALEHGAEARSR